MPTLIAEPMSELWRLDEWLFETLGADYALKAWANGGIHADSAPQGTKGNLVIFAFQGGSHRKQPISYALYLVRAVAEGRSFDLVGEAADRIDRQMLSLPQEGAVNRGLHIIRVQRDQPHQRKDAENGIPVVYLGGVYRAWFERLPAE